MIDMALLPDPSRPLTKEDKLVFGDDAKRHPITGFPLESGIGAAKEAVQARHHCDLIEEQEGKEIADEYRRKLGLI
jgi:hypothetical protein